ncbi:BACON domain-containing protein [Duncaniella muris]|uniref:BACON domain-containing protein n=1 Tax=Duncaniella muris TaxID=2094150 RepID=UPI002714ABCA|nr:BACON domain-containing protein [Duncaniella muris]
MVYANDGYIMLLDAVMFNNKKIGNISDDGIDWGGDSAEYIKLWAAQVRNAPVKKIKKKDGTNVLKFTLIELLPQNCKDVMGGTVTGERWDAPADSVSLDGPLKILAGTGQTIEIKNMTLDGLVRGKIGGDSALGIECELEMVKPADGGSPFSMYPTVPFISATPTQLSFSKDGGDKTIEIDASGPFTAGPLPAGFSMEIVNGRITVTASANTGAARNGTVEFILAADPSKKATVSLSQAASA